MGKPCFYLFLIYLLIVLKIFRSNIIFKDQNIDYLILKSLFLFLESMLDNLKDQIMSKLTIKFNNYLFKKWWITREREKKNF